MDVLICYCFGYRHSDIVRDVKNNDGRSAILEKIIVAKQRGECQCHNHHPERR